MTQFDEDPPDATSGCLHARQFAASASLSHAPNRLIALGPLRARDKPIELLRCDAARKGRDDEARL